VRCPGFLFNIAAIKNRRETRRQGDISGYRTLKWGDNVLTFVTPMTIFTPFFASFGCALRIIFEVPPALLATFTTCF
jgi:hypothetical protein